MLAKRYKRTSGTNRYFTRYLDSITLSTPEIETADLSQSHASLKLSQFRDYCLFHRNSSRATKNK